ncbi:NAD-dependent epimerase/dehydratase family protein [Novosphingobium umbonatum]|uniref:NAD-dependent epimerase/dehydratase family protein n=1 Tax=Novosphingobium umbonatum TaxID=1908524 RepID=A0A3S2US15_9SPHN|nr:hopanoid-associated sugar epimerase [Novosphingobium umbonatum]RVU05453.1 NAD-dependent epimerase/dehydratase family protein [Novosphingobium umbonatum]
MDQGITLVTGVAGFLGSALARGLAARGARLRGLVRGTSSRVNLQDFPGELVEADLRDAAGVERAMAGVEVLYHAAADYRLWARDGQEIIRNNRQMTQVVMQAALAAGVRRVVYTSSVATLRPLAGGVADETRPASEEQAVGVYKRSKVVAEKLVEEMVAKAGLPAVIVNPSTPIGPRDVKPTPTGRIVVEAAQGRMPAFVDTGLNLVHVDDVARGHWLAAERGVIGRRYILGGQDVTLGQMLADIAALTGRRAPRVRLPAGPLQPLAWAAEGWGWLSGREPFVTRDALAMARHHMYFSSARAQAELGYSARPYQQALANAVDWFRAQGMIA